MTEPTQQPEATSSPNPFLQASDLPFELPPFQRIEEGHYLPAFEAGMAEQLAEIAAITANPAPADFENTLVALERSGTLLRRVELVFFNKTSSDSTPSLRELEAEISPRLAAHSDAIRLDPALFARIDAVHARRDELDLDPESLRLLERHHSRFVRSGARLDESGQARLRELNAELATLTTTFERQVFEETRAAALVLDTAEQLAGLPEDKIAAAAENAKALGHDGRYVISLKNFSNQTELASLTDPELRARLLDASLRRGITVNGPVAARMAALRAERAELLGFPSHAAWEVSDQTAGTTEAVESMLGRLVAPAMANADREGAALAAAEGAADGVVAASDWQFLSERVRKEQYDVDTAEMRPYLELESVLRRGVFHAAGLVYGVTFVDRPDLVAYHPDARVFEVRNADGSSVGLFVGDFFARESKRGGAWMNELVAQSGLFGQKPVVVNNLNIAKPPAGEPALLTWDEVRTLFHEFGHALHGLFSDVRYPSLAGTEVPRDFVEYPSQVNEMWQEWPEVLANYARHVETGEPLPAELVERAREAQNFGEGFRTVEYLAAALLDWAWHIRPAKDPIAETPEAAEAFEAEALTRYGLAHPSIPPRYRTGYFAHIFAGGYAAGYYGYIWSEVLDADTVEWFKSNAAAGVSVRESGEIFRRELLSRGGSVDSMGAFAAFRGRAPEIQPLLARRGLDGVAAPGSEA
ncbi:M3 family metallopeptidase [Streptacidiphilus fuscans]|uniref:M3 family metallopeptidase n=1 Tax=Streptacidiphilus fuscans TaxID=2789292 RepID=A0A931B2Y3_9ACTN|nr:M3 family metallopeptidase [Streptacidiphilus fuscans]MBF9070225.1 M3 family metallopeptidase [Streptacidiphilus fuscans]